MELSTPEPWLPVVRTCSVPSAAVLTVPRWYSVRPGFLRIGSRLSRLQQRRWCRGVAHHAQQGGAHEGQEGHHHRHRIAGQAEQDGRRGR
jgi:hypothetical protein